MAHDGSHLLMVEHAKQIFDDMQDRALLRDERFDVFVKKNMGLKDKGVYETSNGGRLSFETGLWIADSDYKCVKYSAEPGGLYYVVSDCQFQFQSAKALPGSGMSNRVGKTYGKYEGYVKVPAGASWIIVVTNRNSGVGKVMNTNVPGVLTWWNSKPYGMYADGADVVVENWGFACYFNGYTYYIAPTDYTTVNRYTGSGGTKFLTIDTRKLADPGVRTDPSEVFEILSVSGTGSFEATWHRIPVAVFHSGSWIFIGAFEKFNRRPAQIKPRLMPALTESHLIAHKVQRMAQIEQAKADGYSIIEFDVQYTADGVPVVNHDDTVTAGGTTYTIKNTTYAALAAAEPALLTLDEALAAAKNARMAANIDYTKQQYTDAQIADTYRRVSEAGMTGQSVFTCYEAVARKLARFDPIPGLIVGGSPPRQR